MDNASIHQNQILWNKQIEWAKKGLTIFFLPTYSPSAVFRPLSTKCPTQ